MTSTDLRLICLIVLPLMIAGLCVLLIWQAQSRPQWIRVFVWFAATPLLLAGCVSACFFIWVASFYRQTVSQPISSPNGRFAARVETWEGFFATDGGTNVKIYSLHGLGSAWAYGGDEYSVEPGNVRWVDDRTLEVRYSYDDEHTCKSTRDIRVICLPIGTPSR